MGFDRKYLICALCFAVVGMALGIYMAASHDHGQFIAHAHILLVGFVASLIYAVIHKLWLSAGDSRLAKTQFLTHLLGAIVMSIGLFLLYGGFVAQATMDSILAVASIAVWAGVVMMLIMAAKSRPAAG